MPVFYHDVSRLRRPMFHSASTPLLCVENEEMDRVSGRVRKVAKHVEQHEHDGLRCFYPRPPKELPYGNVRGEDMPLGDARHKGGRWPRDARVGTKG
jgi:hypothetical protein